MYDETIEAEAKQMLTCLAIGLMRQDKAIRSETSRPVTHLDEYVQWGWDKLTSMCYQQHMEGPRHLPDLVTWLHSPVEEWPGIGSLFLSINITGAMLAYGTPGELCIELDRDIHESGDPERELGDVPFKEILALCKTGSLAAEYDPAEQYVWARQFLVMHPYLPDGTITISSDPRWSPEIRKLLRACYEPLPRACLRYENATAQIARCPRCGWPLQWTSREPKLASCYSDLCSRLVPLFHHPQIWEMVMPDVAMQTTKPIQASVVGPEVPLLRLYDHLTKEMGLRCELWPSVDACDLLVFLSDGEPWAVDMKDYSRPTALAVSLSGKEFTPLPNWDPSQHHAFYVFPDHRRKTGYKQAFLSLWVPPPGGHVEILYVDEFLRRVERRERREASHA